jgi:hypothetical protein
MLAGPIERHLRCPMRSGAADAAGADWDAANDPVVADDPLVSDGVFAGVRVVADAPVVADVPEKARTRKRMTDARRAILTPNFMPTSLGDVRKGGL